MRPAVRCAVLAGLALACAGCTDYLARRDTLTAGSGEAVQANIAQHVIDPWPRHAMTVDPYTDGNRMQRAVERYRNPVSGPNQGGLPLIPVGPANLSPASAAPVQP